MKSGEHSKGAFLLAGILAGASFAVAAVAREAQPAAGQAVGQAAGQAAGQTAGQATTEPAQPPAYKPRFAGDPAHSEAEAGALGYIRTVLMAQKLYKKKHDSFATSLAGLVHTGSFTQRMTKTDRGDYYVSFEPEPKGTGFNLTMTPKQYDDAHRAFFSDDSGIIRVETDKAATENSPRLK
jgi:hypothetical protein